MTATHVVAIAVGLVACGFDLGARRIPNALTFGAAAVALAFHLITGGLSGLGASAAGWIVGVALFLPLFLLGGMGAGDVKLLGAVGAWLGPKGAFLVFIFSCIAGGVMGVLVSLAQGYLRQALTNIWCLLCHWRLVGIRPLPELTLQSGRGPRLPYALPIAAGILVTLWR